MNYLPMQKVKMSYSIGVLWILATNSQQYSVKQKQLKEIFI